MLGTMKNGEPIVATRVIPDFWNGGHKVVGFTSRELAAEAQREFERDRRDDMIREAKLDAERD